MIYIILNLDCPLMNGSHVLMYRIYRNRSITATINNNCGQYELVMCYDNEWEFGNCNEQTTSDHGN